MRRADQEAEVRDLCRAYNQALHERDAAELRVTETHQAMLSAAATFFEGAHG